MPVYAEFATSQRELRVQPSFAQPLPHFLREPTRQPEANSYEVIIVGAGPSGLLATLLLSRYGISDTRLLCIDNKPETLRSGQADGIQPRTTEVIASLGLQHELVDQGCHFWETSFWDPKDGGGIVRTAYAPDIDVPSQYPHEITIHQGRIERIFDDDLKRYSERGVERSATFRSVRFDEDGDPEYPLVIEVDKAEDFTVKQTLHPGRHELRCKFLVGADGAHSTVRRTAELSLTGESRQYIWGVVDFIANTKFPDIRRKSMVQSGAGSCMIIPRERISTGDYLTRLYVHMDETTSDEMENDSTSSNEARTISSEKRKRVTIDRILKQADQVLQPYGIKMKDGTEPDWWAAYEIGQRMCEDFIKRDCLGVPRVFLAGDACHTHSPKAGQGMNVSMMDAYNLSWKLAHYLQNITPESQSRELLESYEQERRQVARELIDYDRALSVAFSQKANAGKGKGPVIEVDQLNEIWKIGHGFTSGCGIEYKESILVQQDTDGQVVGNAYLSGILRPGRRLLNTHILRHADGRPVYIHEELPSVGRFSFLILTSEDLLEKNGRSAKCMALASGLIKRYSSGLLHPIILHPLTRDIRGIDWSMLPPEIYEHAEMSFYSAGSSQSPLGKTGPSWTTQRPTEDSYEIYGISKDRGALVVLRPDQVVGMVTSLDGSTQVQDYLDRWLRHDQLKVQ